MVQNNSSGMVVEDVLLRGMLSKVLIIRFSSIGDVVLTSPVVRCIRNQWHGDVEIHYLTKATFASLLTSNPYINKVWTIQSKVSEVLPELKEVGFDYIFDLHNNLRSGQVKRALPALAFSFAKLNVEKWMLVNLKVDKMPAVHIVERYLETLSNFDIENDGGGLDYFVPKADVVDVATLVGGAEFIAFAIGGSFATKVLPEDKIVAICKAIKRPILLLGGPSDAERASRIVAEAGTHVVSTCGDLRINQSASVVQQAKAVIAHDTGMMHVAAAFGKPLVSVWGNTVPAFGMTPYMREGEGPAHIIEVQDLNCRPCSKLGYDKCPKKHFRCMNDIAVADVLSALPE